MGDKTLKAEDVANWFVVKANEPILAVENGEHEEQEGISHLKLQKILYFAQAGYLALYGKKLFEDDIYAWDLGPVVRSVYTIFKDYKSRPIIKPTNGNYKDSINGQDMEDFLEEIWQIFGKFSASKLVDLTHSHAPWRDAHKKKDCKITTDVLRQYYAGIFVKN